LTSHPLIQAPTNQLTNDGEMRTVGFVAIIGTAYDNLVKIIIIPNLRYKKIN